MQRLRMAFGVRPKPTRAKAAKPRRPRLLLAGIGPAAFALAMACASPGAHAADPTAEMKTLLEQGKAEAAWQLGRRNADQLGMPAFDLWFGIAAVNAGRASEGVLALERVLFAAPDNDTARLELARGYFLLGEDARSREEFEFLLTRKPAPQVERTIREYLDALSARAGRFQSALSGYLELGGGHDSNVPYGVEDPNIVLPVFGEVTLADSAVKASDRFFVVSGGIRFSRPLSARWQLFTGFSAEQRMNRSIDTFDQDLVSGVAGLNWQVSARDVGRLTYSLSSQTIDHGKYRDNAAVSIEWGRQISEAASGTLGVQRAQFRYGGFNGVRDADYDAITLGVRWRGTGRWRPELDLALSGAREKARLADRQDLSRDLAGGRVGISCVPASNWTLSLAGNWLKSEYSQPDPLLLTTRDDRYRAAEVALAWAPLRWTRDFSLRLEWSTATNTSNLPIYEYKRRATTLKLRYDFK
ncbi:MAG: DUF560 domain-containing protein [Betaproteobacteria bacterium]|nr:DUF560 domain-containing protein [Betaproteobacteria bacterium]